MKFGVIYKITNSQNGMIYIGQTKMQVRDRWRLHCSKNSTCSLLHKAIEEYGKEAFKIEVIDSGESREELNQKEKYWIEKEQSISPNGYNLDKGGYFIEYTDEAKKRMSENHADVSGKKNPRYGARCSEETKKLIADRLRGRYTGKNSTYHKAVINIDTGERFDTATEAADKYGVTVSTLTKTCRGVQKRSAGFRWAFIEGGDACDISNE